MMSSSQVVEASVTTTDPTTHPDDHYLFVNLWPHTQINVISELFT